jgi:hypothetical protein
LRTGVDSSRVFNNYPEIAGFIASALIGKAQQHTVTSRFFLHRFLKGLM